MSLKSELERLGVETEEEVVETPQDEDEPKKEEAKDEPKGDVEDAPKGDEGDKDAADKPKEETDGEKSHARLRIERAAEKRRAEEAERRAAELEARLKEPKKQEAVDAEPDKSEDPQAWADWKIRTLEKKQADFEAWQRDKDKREEQENTYSAAIEEFTAHENAFKAKVPDYEAVSSHGVRVIANSIKALNPGLEGKAFGKAVQTKLLQIAGQAVRQGYDPAEYMYYYAKETLDYKPAEPEQEPEKKASVKDIAANKKKSASSMAAGGKGGEPTMNRDGLLKRKMSVAEFSRMTPEKMAQWKALEAQ